MKKYNDFTDEEKESIKILNCAYVMAAYADTYADTLKAQSNVLQIFNKRYGYNFKSFECVYDMNDLEKTYFN